MGINKYLLFKIIKIEHRNERMDIDSLKFKGELYK